ncbi:VgrG protein [Chondromyces apiculatus DSM 436]|uniref:VgrG protein n=1 Tax=Chondromyces apiculatus DSM 436 TaxID=1192034 RepID=A0A017T3S3_9BACT|nr:VgrG protein [Chondromyces apiculatus DSM 436]
MHDDRHGARWARRALAQERAGAAVVGFEAGGVRLRPGEVVRVEGCARPEISGREGLLVVSVATEGGVHEAWTTRAQAVAAGGAWRPARRARKPAAEGVQCAVVVGPEGEAIHTDAHGRVQVRFPWDRQGVGSCWVRVAQGWAGPGMGLFALPRVGQEVLVGFLGGDPDQPVVVGRLSNPLNAPPLKLPEERTQSAWRSGSSPGGAGFNEIRFEDSGGAELLSVRAERDLGLVVRRDRAVAVGGDEVARVEGRQVLFVGEDAHLTTAGERRERVGGTRSLTVEGDQHAQVGGLSALGAGAVVVKARGAVVIEGADVTLRGAGGFVRIDGGGVTIEGAAVKVREGGAPGRGRGATPALPLVPGRAAPGRGALRRLPLVEMPGLGGAPGPNGMPIFIPKGKGGPLTPVELEVCAVICLCDRDRAPHKRKQDCVTARLWAMEEASGHTGKIKAEVPYDMSTRPPTPIMSRRDPRRASRRRWKGSKIPDVVVVRDGARAPTQDNIEKIIEIKFPPDSLHRDQRFKYDDIAGEAPFEVLDPERCGCRREEEEPDAPEVRVEDLAEATLLSLAVLFLLLDDMVPGGQVDDVAIPPVLARILSLLAPLLRGAAPVAP